jgi:hypothetical protein
VKEIWLLYIRPGHIPHDRMDCIPGAKNKAIVFFFSSLPKGLYYKLAAEMVKAQTYVI